VAVVVPFMVRVVANEAYATEAALSMIMARRRIFFLISKFSVITLS
jgi:hypothetical protein